MFEQTETGEWVLDCRSFKGKDVSLKRLKHTVTDIGQYLTLELCSADVFASWTEMFIEGYTYQDYGGRYNVSPEDLANEFNKQLFAQQIDRFKLDGPEYQEAVKEIVDQK